MPISEVYNEDCRTTLSRIADKSVNLLLQDPPFGVTQNDWDIAPDLKQMWPEWERVATDNAAFIFFATQPFAADLICSNRKLFRYDLIWYKRLASGFLNAKKMPLRNHESVLVFYRKLPTYNPQMGVGIRKKGVVKNERLNSNYNKFGGDKNMHYYDDNGTRYPQSVLDFSNGDRTTDSFHPNQKPLDLIRYLVLTYSNPGDVVFDGYLGSGTTLIASEMEGRFCKGSETKKSYYHHILKRRAEQTAQQQLFT